MQWILIIVSMLIACGATVYMKSTEKKYRKIVTHNGLTGAEAARRMLEANNVFNVQIEMLNAEEGDHFDADANTIRLSRQYFTGTSVAAVGVAMHEAGHALQHAAGYAPLKIRHAAVRTTNASSMLSYFLVLLGIIFSSYALITVGIWFFIAVVAFQFITLPVEFNASRRALASMRSMSMLTAEEQKGARKVLTAAALTYVAAFLISVLQIIRLMLIRGSRE